MPRRTLLVYLWTFPTTFVGLLVVAATSLRGCRVRVRNGVLEAEGSGVEAFLACGIPGIGCVPAMTLGHVVLAVDQREMARWRVHELVHVGQCERWGPLFLPAYLTCSLAAWWRGADPYYDNHFERAAYDHDASPPAIDTRRRPTASVRAPDAACRHPAA